MKNTFFSFLKHEKTILNKLSYMREQKKKQNNEKTHKFIISRVYCSVIIEKKNWFPASSIIFLSLWKKWGVEGFKVSLQLWIKVLERGVLRTSHNVSRISMWLLVNFVRACKVDQLHFFGTKMEKFVANFSHKNWSRITTTNDQDHFGCLLQSLCFRKNRKIKFTFSHFAIFVP